MLVVPAPPPTVEAVRTASREAGVRGKARACRGEGAKPEGCGYSGERVLEQFVRESQNVSSLPVRSSQQFSRWPSRSFLQTGVRDIGARFRRPRIPWTSGKLLTESPPVRRWSSGTDGHGEKHALRKAIHPWPYKSRSSSPCHPPVYTPTNVVRLPLRPTVASPLSMSASRM